MNMIMTRLTVVAVAALMLVACASDGERAGAPSAGGAPPAASGGPSDQQGTGDAGGGAEAVAVPGQEGFQGDPLSDPSSPLSQRVVYFDFDKSNIKDEDRETLEAHAEYLADHSDVQVTLEGHADERGTREYNMALGERRAKAVYRFLTLMGVSASQLKTISFGEERPAVRGHDESAWSKNRRVELDYKR